MDENENWKLFIFESLRLCWRICGRNMTFPVENIFTYFIYFTV
ncbi:MAG: hypothetical protein QOD67_375 [Caballeronia sp.]|jgi:hypothetical protein|nr:hypothetical protein [Caballeronia sp.]MEA3123356.1 hypothetical protein [Caballeronia sp.]